MAAFEDAQRIAKMLASSTMVPIAYQGTNNVPNVLVALEISNRMQVSPLMVMQNLDIIQGKPGFNAKFTAALVNNCGKYTPLRYVFTGEGPTRACRAVATELSTGSVCEGPPCSIALAKAEGWYDKPKSKWPNMPDLMLTYRCAKFWANVFEPGLTMGIPTSEELLDISDYQEPATTRVRQGASAVDKLNSEVKTEKVDFTDHVVVSEAAKDKVVQNEELI